MHNIFLFVTIPIDELYVTCFIYHVNWKSSSLYKQWCSNSPFWIEDIKNFRRYDNYVITNTDRRSHTNLNDPNFNFLPLIEVNKCYGIKEIVNWLDYFQVIKKPILNNNREYVDFTAFKFVVKINEKGTYKIKGCFRSDKKKTYWILRISDKVTRRSIIPSIAWYINESDDWTYQFCPKSLILEPGEYIISFEPINNSPLSEICIIKEK